MSEEHVKHEKHEVFLVLRHEGITDPDWANLLDDARRITTKLEEKTGVHSAVNEKARPANEQCHSLGAYLNTYEATIFADLDEFASAWSDPYRLYGVTKLHIIAHGNQKISGPFSAEALAELIAGKNAMQIHTRLERITVHSCMAGSSLTGSLEGQVVNDSTKKSIFVEQVASALARFVPQGRRVLVRGSNGKSYTDVDGRNWILTDTKDDVARDPSKPQVERDSFHSLFTAKNKISRAKERGRWTATSVGTAS
jgi:hypothetical protein